MLSSLAIKVRDERTQSLRVDRLEKEKGKIRSSHRKGKETRRDEKGSPRGGLRTGTTEGRRRSATTKEKGDTISLKKQPVPGTDVPARGRGKESGTKKKKGLEAAAGTQKKK